MLEPNEERGTDLRDLALLLFCIFLVAVVISTFERVPA